MMLRSWFREWRATRRAREADAIYVVDSDGRRTEVHTTPPLDREAMHEYLDRLNTVAWLEAEVGRLGIVIEALEASMPDASPDDDSAAMRRAYAEVVRREAMWVARHSQRDP